MIMMCQHRFINCNKCTTVVREIDGGGGFARVGTVCTFAQFCCEPTTALKIKIII